MTTTFTQSETGTFSVTDAKYIASKVKTDLMRFHRYYYRSHNAPEILHIENLNEEFELLLFYNLLHEIEYGFKKNGVWEKALKYSSRQSGVMDGNDVPGGIGPTPISADARFSSFLVYNERSYTCEEDMRRFRSRSPITRGTGIRSVGNWDQQRSYSSGGRGVLRSGI